MTKKTLIIILSVVGALVLLVVLFVGAILGLVFYTLSRSEAAQTAKGFLQSNQKLKQDIGEVKDFGSIITGNVNTQNNSGEATLRIKVIGERRTVNATVVLMYREGRNWRVTDATYINEQGQTVELLDKYGPASPEQ
ncbi:MAG TPA: cytochrome c oxidase assembly factor Coa1 family protein [Pyrinomonadaceae bacterium]|jgi:flagellar basal body-associated protein FliL